MSNILSSQPLLKKINVMALKNKNKEAEECDLEVKGLLKLYSLLN